tara:strand:+ start:39 stop:1307 length:1269 start_codon:yes stop_codon:yes gene_type:complete
MARDYTKIGYAGGTSKTKVDYSKVFDPMTKVLREKLSKAKEKSDNLLSQAPQAITKMPESLRPMVTNLLADWRQEYIDASDIVASGMYGPRSKEYQDAVNKMNEVKLKYENTSNGLTQLAAARKIAMDSKGLEDSLTGDTEIANYVENLINEDYDESNLNIKFNDDGIMTFGKDNLIFTESFKQNHKPTNEFDRVISSTRNRYASVNQKKFDTFKENIYLYFKSEFSKLSLGERRHQMLKDIGFQKYLNERSGGKVYDFKEIKNGTEADKLIDDYLEYLTEGTKAFFNTDPTEVELKEGNFIANEVIRQWRSGEFTTLPRYGYTTRYDKKTDTFAIIDRNGKEKTVKFGKTTEGLKALLRQLMVPESIVTNIDYEAIEFGMDKKKNKKTYKFDTSIYNKDTKEYDELRKKNNSSETQNLPVA